MTVDEFETSDAAYVMGSLSHDEQLAFQAHLKSCDACTARVAQARELLELLALAPSAAFEGSARSLPPDDNGAAETRAGQGAVAKAPPVSAPGAVPDTLLPRLLRVTRRERNRRRLIGGAFAVAAACIVAVVAIMLSATPASNPYQVPPQASAMVNLVDAPIQAKAEIITTNTWAQVNVWCTYNAHSLAPGNYQAVARTKTGQTVLVGSWPGVPGQTAIIRTPTHLHTPDIASIEILTSTGKPISQLTL